MLFIQSIVASHYFFPSLIAYKFRIERNWHFLRLSMNRVISWYLYMKRTSVRIGSDVTSIRTSSETGQYQKSTAGGVGLPISTFPSMF